MKNSCIIIICSNQISLGVAIGIYKQTKQIKKIIIIYYSQRVDISYFNNKNVICIDFNNKFSILLFLLKSLIFGYVEMCIPHTKFSWLVKTYSKLCNKVSLIDDGVDTFRNYQVM